MARCEGAVAPKNTFTEEDVRAGTDKLAQWLTGLTGDAVNWRTVITVGEMLPVAGSIFAAADAIGDIIELAQGDATYRADLYNWVGLGINLFGLVPLPGVGAARAVMRPSLKTLRTTKGDISQALLTTIESALADVCPGDLEAFVKEVEATLHSILKAFAQKVIEVCKFLADLIRSVASGAVQDVALTVLFPGISLIVEAADAFKRRTGFGFGKDDIGLGDRQKQQLQKTLEPVAASIEQIGNIASDKIIQTGSETNPDSLLTLIRALSSALQRRKNAPHQANMAPGRTNEARRPQPQNGTQASPAQRSARADGNCQKQGSKAGTQCSISFAMGSETIVHTDFELPGTFPLVWNRTYRSSLSAFDNNPFGARWITPFSSRFDLSEDQLTYHATDGRSHHYPLPDVHHHHLDPIENLVIARTSKNKLVLLRGHDSQEHYERVSNQFRLTAISLRGGARIALHYEHQHAEHSVLSDLLTYQNDTPHQHIHTQIDDQGRIKALWLMHDGQALRQLARYEFDHQGDLRAARDEHDAQWNYDYQHHLLTRYTDRTGRGMNLQWQGNGPDAKAVREWADDGSQDTRLSWDPNIRLTRLLDANGQETLYYYDVLGYTYRIIHPDSNEEWFYRDDAKNLTQHIHTDGSVDSYAYDERGNLVQHTRPDGTSVHHAYDDQDLRFKTRDAEGGLWKYDYDPRGNIIETLDPLEHKTQYRYNSDNLPVAIIDANGAEKKLAYNADGQLIRYTDCSGKTSQWRYNALGQLSQVTDAAGMVTSYHYQAGQLSRIVHPDKTEERFERDAEGRLLDHIDALQRRTVWQYNEAGLIQQRRNADGSILNYRWDRLGQLVELRNENNSTATFKYDPVGRLLKETGFDQQTTHYLYDNGSNQPTRRLDGDRVTCFEYDPLGRLLMRQAGQRTAQQWQTETFAYDGNGNLLLAENDACKLQWFYDAAGNNTREHQYLRYLKKPHVAIWRHEYDALNQRVATVRPDGHRVSWLTYGSGHLLALKLDDRELLNYQRDDLHREIGREQGNGLQQRQSWTPNGHLQEQTVARRGESSRLSVRNYRYDVAGQLTNIQDLRRGAINYRYDPVGRLLEAGSLANSEHFAFDPASNLLDPQAPQERNGYPRSKLLDNLLRDYCGKHYLYDERGNLKERIENGKKATFSWDLYDRLTHYEDDRLTVYYAYDALGRRLCKRSRAKYQHRREAGPAWNQNEQRKLDQQYGCGNTLYGWDGDTLAFENRTHDLGARLTHYVYEPGTFVPVAQALEHRSIKLLLEPVYDFPYDIERDPVWQHKPAPAPFDAFAWYQCDHLGTPMELTDEQGEVAWSGTYKAWGAAQEKRSDTAKRAGIHNPLRFQGQYFDVETGLHYNRYRYYDPGVGRFVGKDPIGFAGGLNVYAYAPNPVEWVDPLGLAKRGPVPGGKGPHNEAIAQWGQEVVDANGTVHAGGGRKPERLIPTPGGHKQGRRPDIIFEEKDGKIIYGNVGRQKADGTPVSREVGAINDLKTKTTGNDTPAEVQFRPYCPCKTKGQP
ncbi:DUF6531 domain-containing protein [Pseudomonas sp. B21-032]|uniref:RHS repeat-associated core domain-containing protein n=1 Tax=Pseudomonas sp. B21-032 TaxID=2895483 RepID=UPI002160C137|nr:RHS repeat-associated core domain-containing protein [Pseudomonas sp. B21-032]UVL59531.1 DUF6531 domain-containing protein [Pseudomonas sp. B21-032]